MIKTFRYRIPVSLAILPLPPYDITTMKTKILPSLLTLLTVSFALSLSPVHAGEDPSDPPPSHPLHDLALPFTSPDHLAPLIEEASRARLVLLGESTHGTSEFYAYRDAISRRLVADHGFRFIAVEGDWNSLYQLNRYVKGRPDAGPSVPLIMKTFTRWPQWMWANHETAALIEWLREFNQTLPPDQRVGFYGIDVYGQETSLHELPRIAARHDPELGQWIADQTACLTPFGGDIGAYIGALRAGMQPCAEALAAITTRLRDQREALDLDPADYLYLKQMAWVVKNAEKHVRAMDTTGPDSWNYRARHFFQTVERLLDHYGPDARGIVWAHNTHIGDARATSMIQGGQLNIGQLARERFADNAYAVGFGAYRGLVIAGRQWGGPREVMTIPPAGPGSFEAFLHAIGPGNHLILMSQAAEHLNQIIGNRAIGVIYHPEREFPGNYVPTLPAQRYNAFVFFEETRPLQPIDP
ncbi:MAG TPA: erythromycin esterase family protein [Kiritimatiellia bacterium]|nr:erythromycin esterase family protein [Kiritimatiellia bacterium]